jgi:hypothetical protein
MAKTLVSFKREVFGIVFLFMYFIQHCFICRPSVPEDAGIELITVATLALIASRAL